jgi:glycosyltransferase involved in cell wall biosynthesis
MVQPTREVVFLLSTLGIGGSESKTIRLVNALVGEGINAKIAYLNPPDTLIDRVAPGVTVTHLGRRGKYSARALRRLYQVVRGRTVTIFAVNLYPLLYAVPTAKLAALAGSRVIGLVNTAELTGSARHLGLVYGPLLRRCDKVVFGCQVQMNHWMARYRIDRLRCSHIYNGVDERFFAPQPIDERSSLSRQALGIPINAVVFGSVGRLAPEKNFELLIDAAGKLHQQGRNAYLVIVGDGRERTSLERRASAAGISEKVRFPGSQRDVRSALAVMDVFVLPSSSVETFSNAALEAMSMGCPVVLSNVGGAAEMIEHGRSGLLFAVGDESGLVSQMNMLYESANRRREIGEQARNRILERFRFEDMVAQYKALASC